MVSEERRFKVEKIEKFNKDLPQAKTDVVTSGVFTGLYALIAAGGFLTTNNPELFGVGIVIGTGASLVSTGYLALLVKKIRDKSLLEKNIENESSRKLR